MGEVGLPVQDEPLMGEAGEDAPAHLCCVLAHACGENDGIRPVEKREVGPYPLRHRTAIDVHRQVCFPVALPDALEDVAHVPRACEGFQSALLVEELLYLCWGLLLALCEDGRYRRVNGAAARPHNHAFKGSVAHGVL